MRQATSTSSEVKSMYETTNWLWFCSSCKYPPCQKCCTKTRVSKREQRFQTWTCAECKKSAQQDSQWQPAERKPYELPRCAQCLEHAPLPVKHNSWVTKKDYFKFAATPTTEVKRKYEVTSSLWFCMSCKYPPCSKCGEKQKERRENRFQTWMCPNCKSKQPDAQWEASFANLRTVALAHGGVPSSLPKKASAAMKAAKKFAEEQITLYQKGRLEVCKSVRFNDIVERSWNQ